MAINPLSVKLAAMVVHLVEAHSPGGHQFDLDAARSVMADPEVAEILKPGPLVPLTRSGHSVAQLLGVESIKSTGVRKNK